MRKILFNDFYGLTDAVLQGRKTMTRRMIKDGTPLGNWGETEKYSKYKIGEVVAVAQSYKDLGYTEEWVEQHVSPNPNTIWNDPFWKKYSGWNNKMFVKSEFMLHQIRITDIKVERLQDIGEEDCMREGIYVSDTFTKYGIRNGYSPQCANDTKEKKLWFNTPGEAFAALIDKVSGKGTWERNPWTFVYSFELIK